MAGSFPRVRSEADPEFHGHLRLGIDLERVIDEFDFPIAAYGEVDGPQGFR